MSGNYNASNAIQFHAYPVFCFCCVRWGDLGIRWTAFTASALDISIYRFIKLHIYTAVIFDLEAHIFDTVDVSRGGCTSICKS
jgi:hypothetical protein